MLGADRLPHTTPYFCKSRFLPKTKNKVRATLTALRLSRSCPAITEITNNLNMAHLDYVPTMLAYGFRKNACGLISGTAIATEFLGSCMNLREYLELYPDKRESIITSALSLISIKLKDEVFHLDFWLENILIDRETAQLWLIDLEYCRFKSSTSYQDQLSFCLGYFYHCRLNEYISSESYFTIVESWLAEKMDSNHAKEILSNAVNHSVISMNRRTRMARF